ncbi:MAG TPA: DUF1206 domain-containing protein [Polyangiaceae bacterium]|nr:DUF1206 domain-containing protein [Polyangiaceae bacterium]
MHPERSDLIGKLARAGYIAKGVVYGVVGVLAAQVAIASGGKLAGEREAVAHLGQQSFGGVLLWLIAIGLFAYSGWRLIEGALDPHRLGNDGKALAQRFGFVLSALLNVLVAVAALQLAMGEGSGQGSSRTWAASLLAKPAGAYLLGIAGLAVLAFGVNQIYAGVTTKFARQFELGRASEQMRSWVLWSGRVGRAARGLIFAMVGVGFVKAAISFDPGQSRDLPQALGDIAAQPFGRALLFAVATALAIYGAHLVTTAKYRKLGAY